MNAIELLKKDHETVKGLLGKLEDTTERAVQTRKKLLLKIEQELKIHTELEEQIFYPAFRRAGSKDDAVLAIEAKEEHRAVEALVLPDIKETSPSTLEFAGRVKVLKELLEHHIEEEERDMFPQASKLLSKRQLQELGESMEVLRKSLKSDAQATIGKKKTQSDIIYKSCTKTALCKLKPAWDLALESLAVILFFEHKVLRRRASQLVRTDRKNNLNQIGATVSPRHSWQPVNLSGSCTRRWRA